MTHFEARMAEFRARFLERAARDERAIAEAFAAGDLPAVRALCHGLSGNAGMFGFGEVGELAQAAEQAIESGADEVEVRVLTDRLLTRLAVLDQGR